MARTATANITETINPTLIRNYHFIRTANQDINVQFVAIGDKHRMMKNDDGSMSIIKEKEQGKPYRYGTPIPLDLAISILEEGHYNTHADIANHIRESASTL